MPRMLRLKAPVRVSHSVNTDDVVSVKRALSDLGLYDPPGPLHGALDSGMLNGIEAFQRMNTLQVDREVAPGGETERALNERLFGEPERRKSIDLEAEPDNKRSPESPLALALGLADPRETRQARPLLQPVQNAEPTVPAP